MRRFLTEAGVATAGGAGAAIVYSALNAAIYHVSPLFMIIQQVGVAQKELSRVHMTFLQSGVLQDGYWLTIHCAVLLAALLLLARAFFLAAADRRLRRTEIFFHGRLQRR